MKEKINSLSGIRGQWPRIFFDPAGATNCRRDNMTQGKISVKRQATSYKPPDSGFKRQATSSKDYLKNFLLMRIPEALVQASGLRLPGSGSLCPHKVLER